MLHACILVPKVTTDTPWCIGLLKLKYLTCEVVLPYKGWSTVYITCSLHNYGGDKWTMLSKHIFMDKHIFIVKNHKVSFSAYVFIVKIRYALANITFSWVNTFSQLIFYGQNTLRLLVNNYFYGQTQLIKWFKKVHVIILKAYSQKVHVMFSWSWP